jgi:hypothetical protein
LDQSVTLARESQRLCASPEIFWFGPCSAQSLPTFGAPSPNLGGGGVPKHRYGPSHCALLEASSNSLPSPNQRMAPSAAVNGAVTFVSTWHRGLTDPRWILAGIRDGRAPNKAHQHMLPANGATARAVSPQPVVGSVCIQTVRQNVATPALHATSRVPPPSASLAGPRI